MLVEKSKIQSEISIEDKSFHYYRLNNLPGGEKAISRLPFSLRVLLEGVLRHFDGLVVTDKDIINLLEWKVQSSDRIPTPFYPSRVIMQDLSGVPVMNDLAAMRAALVRNGGRPEDINPQIPVDLVIDHSIQVDYFGTSEANKQNSELEFERNKERYNFLRWCQNAFKNFRIVPPSSGIIHQVNLESLANVVQTTNENGNIFLHPETQVGTDSHTTMINGLGVVGWGVGGIEAIAAMLGEPIEFLTPDVVGFKLTGHLKEGVTPTDLTLTVIQMLRKLGVVDKFVEFFGPGLSSLSLADRAMIANMSPESGATMIYFPVDDQTLNYLKLSGRSAEQVELVKTYCQAQQLFRHENSPEPDYSLQLTLDLSTVEPSVAGPKRPQDRLALSQVKVNFQVSLGKPKTDRGYAIPQSDQQKSIQLQWDGHEEKLGHGSVIIAAITSCTNTSNPFVMVGAGLLAKKAVEKGLTVKPYVKTSLAPGSRVVSSYLEKAGLMGYLEQLGFHVVGYGCTTCIGNSGPVNEQIASAISKENLVAAAVLSGNRNFEGRVHPSVQANYLASPPLVVAYALAGTIDKDLTNEPVGTSKNGIPVYLREIWPSSDEILECIESHIKPSLFKDIYEELYTSNPTWSKIESGTNLVYEWDPLSTYLQEPPFFDFVNHRGQLVDDIQEGRVLALFGDSITTDHISPAASIAVKSPAGKYLIEKNIEVKDFNTYGSRRGNDRVMTRGTFANIRIKNLLLKGVEGGLTIHFPEQTQMTIYDAAIQYRKESTSLIVIAGKEYGTGSSRDWAAKGAQQLGVRAILAESYERIHRSNLAGMGVLPLQFLPGENAVTHRLTGHERFSITGLSNVLEPSMTTTVKVIRENNEEYRFNVKIRLDTMNEIRYFHNGGLLSWILINRLPK